VWLIVTGGFLVVISLFVYGNVAKRIATEGGKVRTDNFGTADLLVASLLILYFVTAVLQGFHVEPKPVHGVDIVNGAVMFLTLVVFLCSFLHFRGIKLPAQFGVRRLGPGRVAGIAVGLLAAAYPLIGLVSILSQVALGTEAQPQELVKYFLDASEKSHYSAIFATMLMGVVFAPIAEEFIFRGYFYGILKRHLGIVAGVILNAALFAAIHLNETSLLSLFVLAVCFTLAYEFTGSILVNMCMHSLFNLANLCLLLYTAHHPVP